MQRHLPCFGRSDRLATLQSFLVGVRESPGRTAQCRRELISVATSDQKLQSHIHLR